jgi:hypothetical protein
VTWSFIGTLGDVVDSVILSASEIAVSVVTVEEFTHVRKAGKRRLRELKCSILNENTSLSKIFDNAISSK